MLPQIVCLSCGYQRTWPTMLEALADGQRHHAEHPEPALSRRASIHRWRREAHVGTPVRGLRAAFVIVGKPLA